MLSTQYLFELTGSNKQKLGITGRAALVGGAGLGLYRSLKHDDSADENIIPKSPGLMQGHEGDPMKKTPLIQKLKNNLPTILKSKYK